MLELDKDIDCIWFGFADAAKLGREMNILYDDFRILKFLNVLQ